MKSKLFRQRVEQLKGEKLKTLRSIKDNLDELKQFRSKVKNLEEARELLNLAAKETQSKLQYHIYLILLLWY